MPQYPLRVSLNSANFPFTTEMWGRSIVVPQFDQNFDRTTLNAPGVVVDKGIPQAYYMHNVLPTPQGYQSIGYVTPIIGMPGHTDFDQVFTLQDPDGKRVLFCPAGGKGYIFDSDVGNWVATNPTAAATADTLVSTATVQGQTYVFFEKIGAFKYNNTTKLMDAVTLTALDITKIIGIANSSGYMVAWSTVNVAWSSLITPTDFTPDLTTGAGGGAINEAAGTIRFCLPMSGGFVVYCDFNAVAARYSGNINFPFIFKEIPGSAGIFHSTDVSYHANLAYHLVWDGNGLQQVSLTTTTSAYVEAMDFLAGQVFEDVDDTTLAFTTTYLDQPVSLNVTIISARFVVISYGVIPNEFTHALVYDLALNRWGKLKIDHHQCFQYTFPNFTADIRYQDLGATTYAQLAGTSYADFSRQVGTRSQDEFKHSFSFLQKDGTVKIVDFELSERVANGLLLLGKYQFQRSQRIEHQIAEIDTIPDISNNFQYMLLPSQDGKTLGRPIPVFLAKNGDRTKIYKQMVNAYSLSALFQGQFHLTSLTFIFTMGGYSA